MTLPKEAPHPPRGDEDFRFCTNSRTQWRFYASRARELLMSSGFGKGKTRVLCEKADLSCRLYPDNRVVLSRKTLASMWSTTLDVLLNQVIDGEHRSWGWRPHALGGATLSYPNGSQMLCVGLDDPGRALSGAFGMAYIDQVEELSEDEGGDAGINGRLRLQRVPWRQWGGVCNPREPSHWICRRFKADKVPAGGLLRQRTEFDVKLPDGTVIPRGYLLRETVVSGPADNYENLPDDYKLVLASMKGRYKLRFVDGLWVAFEGSVYGDVFNEDVNVRPKPDEWVKWGGYPPPDWPRYRACDFGWENPFVFQWWAKRPERDQFWLYREIYRRHRTTSEHAERINELEKREMDTLRERVVDVSEDANEVRRWMEYLVDREYRLSVCDHDPDGRETLARRGIEMDMADKDVRAGVQTVYQLMGVDADGEPGLVFIRDAVDEVDEELVQEEKPLCTWQEVPGYRWKPAREGENAREEPVKEHDHGQDAERYLFHTLKVGGDLWAGVNA